MTVVSSPRPARTRRPWGRRAELAILLLCTLLGLAMLASATATIWSTRESALANGERALSQLSLALVQHTERTVLAVDLAVTGLQQSFAQLRLATPEEFRIALGTEAVQQMLADRIKDAPQIDAITLVARDGKLINYSRGWPVAEVDVSDRDYFKALSTNPGNGPYISEPVVSRGSGHWNFYLIRPIAGPDGKPLGWILGALVTSYFEEFFAQVAPSSGATISLFRSDGVLLARSPDSQSFIGRSFGRQPLFTETLAASDHGIVRTSASAFDDLARIMAPWAAPHYPLVVNVTELQPTLLAQWASLARLIAIITTLGLLLTLALAAVLIRQTRMHGRLLRAELSRERAEELRRQELRAAEAGKLEALGRLASGVAHDFNNVLGGITGFAQFLVEDLAHLGEQRKFAERILTACGRGRDLVRQILLFARREAVAHEPTGLNAIVAESASLLRASLPKTVSIEIDDRWPDCVVRGDAGKLGQVLINLGINAGHAMEGRPGRLVIAVAAVDESRDALRRLPRCAAPPSPAFIESWTAPDGTGWVATGALPETRGVSVSVRDSGSGLPLAGLARIFEPFFSTKADSGTGLGLAVVQSIVVEHGGAIIAHSREGAGTGIEIILPTTDAAAAIEQAAILADAPAPPPEPGPGARMLLVDDDEDSRGMCETALRRLGYGVVAFADPREALAALCAEPDAWELLLTDHTMPYLTGTDLVRAGKAVSPGTRAIMMTGSESPEIEQQARAAGSDAFLVKPVDLAALAATVARLLEKGEAGVGFL